MLQVSYKRLPIRPLSEQLANQIAAGEVVERPASIVKELIENSLDAGARQIDIDIERGGLNLIRIRDNGHGIPEAELSLAVQAHTTNKISCIDDLIRIESMGFRGEALASIVSISHFDLVSCSVMGSAVDSEQMATGAWAWNNTDRTIHPASHSQGTTVTVQNVFYNTPARRKFMRSERTEFRHIEDVVKRMALGRFNIGFSLRHNQRSVFNLKPAISPEQQTQRLQRLLGKDVMPYVLQVSWQASCLQLDGWLSTVDYSRGQTDMQYFYINGRIVRDKVINHAIRQVYQGQLPPGRHPVYVLSLQLDPGQIDVNVHPTKHEVRFRESRLVHDFIHSVIARALQQNDTHNQTPDPSHNPVRVNPAGQIMGVYSPVKQASPGRYAGHVREPQPIYRQPAPSSANRSERLLGQALAITRQKYLIAENQQGLVLVDMPRAQRMLVQHQWCAAVTEQRVESKPLLMPLRVRVKPAWVECCETHQHRLQQLGLDISVQSPHEVMLRALPVCLAELDHTRLVNNVLQIFTQQADMDVNDLIEKLLVNIIDVSSFSDQSLQQANHLLAALETLYPDVDNPYRTRCWRVLTTAEITKLFQSAALHPLDVNS